PLDPQLTAAMSAGADEPSEEEDDDEEDEPEAEPDPLREAREALWEELEACDYEGQTALFLKTLDTPDLLAEGMGVEMLDQVFRGAAKRRDADGFEILVRAFQERAPEIFRDSATSCLSWVIELRVACGRFDEVGPLAKEIAACAGDQIDIFNLTLDSLAYHCDLSTLVEMMRIGWPGVRDAGDILSWGVEEFVDRAYRYEMIQYCSRAAAPRPDDPELIERLAFYGEPVDEDFVTAFVGSFTGQVRQDAVPGKKRGRWCHRACMEFLGYLVREEGVRPGKADQGSENLSDYLLARLDGRLEHCPRLYEPGQRPERRKGESRRTQSRAVHVLCPDAKTLEPYLARQLGFLSARYCTVAATMEIVPAWLRFLQQRQLIDSREHQATLQGLAKLHADLLKLWKKHSDDPALHEAAIQAWQEPQPSPQQA
ncbi:MAG TPA: hypothetical protein VMY37_40170, partial [Thermoguttaceae bacterium]|nr:hypothetical protein [Thermoguttaceae bacterium]